MVKSAPPSISAARSYAAHAFSKSSSLARVTASYMYAAAKSGLRLMLLEKK